MEWMYDKQQISPARMDQSYIKNKNKSGVTSRRVTKSKGRFWHSVDLRVIGHSQINQVTAGHEIEGEVVFYNLAFDLVTSGDPSAACRQTAWTDSRSTLCSTSLWVW